MADSGAFIIQTILPGHAERGFYRSCHERAAASAVIAAVIP